MEVEKILEIFAEFTEIADKVKLIQMSVLMKSDKPKRAKEKFQRLLESLPVDLVRISFKTCFHFSFKVSSTSIGEEGTLLQSAVNKGKMDFARILLEFG